MLPDDRLIDRLCDMTVHPRHLDIHEDQVKTLTGHFACFRAFLFASARAFVSEILSCSSLNCDFSCPLRFLLNIIILLTTVSGNVAVRCF